MKQKDIVTRLQRSGFTMFDARPYPFVVVPYDLDNKKHIRAVQRHAPGSLDRDLTTCNGLCSAATIDGFKLVLVGVRMQHGDRYSILAHEVFHAMNFMYDHCGVRHDADNDESSAYFLQDIYRQTLAALEEYAR